MNVPAAHWLPTANGYRFCLLHRPQGPRGIVVHVHPFAEEMNKARRMAALMARRLVERGWLVVQVDLHGCGDSDGDFGDATLQSWQSDVADALGYARTLAPAADRVWLWAVRGGALIIPPLLAEHPRHGVLLWQPVTSGSQMLAQFLRLKVAAQSIAGGERVDSAALRLQLQQHGALEIAGYRLGKAMAEQLERARLELPPGHQGPVAWIELGRDGELMPATRSLCTAWSDAGIAVRPSAVSGSPFWQTQEVSEAPQFIEQSLAAIDETFH